MNTYEQRMSGEPPEVAHFARTKPLLRGWFHAAAAVMALPLSAVLCWYCREDPPRLYSVLIFCLTTIALYTVSAIYHIGTWQNFWHRFFHSFDHANIYLYIAGTYTPICFNVLSGWPRILTLSFIWLSTGIGVYLALFYTSRMPRWLKISLYASMGWVGVLTIPVALSVLPALAVGTMIFGGLLYTVGGLVYGFRWPNPYPRYFGYHEIFHLLVIAGGFFYVLTIWVWVLPFPRG